MAAELGQTTDPRELIPGEPEQITGDLRQLVGSIQKMGGIGEDLHGIDPSQWMGEASDAFRQVFGAEPAKWTQVADLAGESGKALADFGDALTWGQGEAQRAIEQAPGPAPVVRRGRAAEDDEVFEDFRVLGGEPNR